MHPEQVDHRSYISENFQIHCRSKYESIKIKVPGAVPLENKYCSSTLFLLVSFVHFTDDSQNSFPLDKPASRTHKLQGSTYFVISNRHQGVSHTMLSKTVQNSSWYRIHSEFLAKIWRIRPDSVARQSVSVLLTARDETRRTNKRRKMNL